MANINELNQPPRHPLWDFLARIEDNPFNFGPRIFSNPPPPYDGPAAGQQQQQQQEGGESSRSAGADTTSHPEPRGSTEQGGQSQDRPGWGGWGYNPYGMGPSPPFTNPCQGYGYGYGYTPWGGFNSFGGPRGHSHRGGRGGHHRGGCHGHRGPRRGPEPQDPGTSQLPAFLQNLATSLGSTLEQYFPNQNPSNSGGQVDFTPPVDIIDMSANYTIHISLPGAKREDISVEYDEGESVLRIAGVVYRPDLDEEMHQGLVVSERSREVGVFEREVRLGTRVAPARVLVDEIKGKLVDGVLKIVVPKVQEEEKGEGEKKKVVVEDGGMEVDDDEETVVGEKEKEKGKEEDGDGDGSSDGREYVRVDVQ